VTRIALAAAWARKRRLLGAFLAVFLGVSFLSGTLVLGATLQRNFDELFADANAGTDAVVRSATSVDSEPGFERETVDAALVERIRDVPGVASAVPYVEGYGQLLDRDGEAIGGNGPPRLAASWIEDPDLNAYALAEGRAPRGAGEVVINRGAAEAGGLAVGDTTVIETPRPVRVRIVGVATFGDEAGFGDATYAAFALPTAQRLVLGGSDRVTNVRVAAAPGVTQEQLVARLARVLPPDVRAVTGAAETRQDTEAIGDEFLDGLRAFLVVFAGIALLVGAFSIANTLSILTAQRTRESALLRAVGASRRQVRAAQLAESAALGLVASVAGLVGGIGIATALKALFDAFGGALPDGGLVLSPGTAVVSVLVGVLVTALAGLAPARRASRVPPLAALRDVAVESTGASRVRVVSGAALGASGAGAVVLAAVALDDGALAVAGLGALAVLAATALLGPALARPAAALLGVPLRRLRGAPGALARENAMRNPRRTAATAAALMVGVGVVALLAVVAGSLKASLEDGVERSFTGDLAIATPGWGGGGLDPRLAERVRALPEIEDAVGVGQGAARVGGSSEQVAIVDPARLDGLVDVDLGVLGPDELAVSRDLADERGWQVGSPVPVLFADGARERMTVGAVHDEDELLGDVLLSRAAWAPHAGQDLDRAVFLTAAPGVGAAVAQAAVRDAVRGAGDPDVQTRAEYVEASSAGVDMLLGIVYVLLLLAVVIALMGIANTLSLSIHERARELGLLRAVGATRRQLRAAVRGEALLVAALGTLGGLALGTFLGWGFVRAAGDGSLPVLSVPLAQLAVVLVVGTLAGVLAAVRPARRAGRMEVVRAVAVE
jgi:putative ABC transport system permease protein